MSRKIIFLICLFVGIGMTVNLSAQNRPNGNVERRIDKQTAQMVATLNLDENTSVQFTKVYKQYLKDLIQCQHGRMAGFDKSKINKGQMTDEQIEKMIEFRFAQSRKILDIREKYFQEFKKFLNPRQIMKVYHEERMNGMKVKKVLEQRNRKTNQ